MNGVISLTNVLRTSLKLVRVNIFVRGAAARAAVYIVRLRVCEYECVAQWRVCVRACVCLRVSE